MPLIHATAATAVETLDEAYVHIGDSGSRALWISFFILAASTVYFMFGMFSMKDGQRKFHIYSMGVTGIATVAYLTMASGGGYIGGEDGVRQFFYARYIDWSFTTPLQLLDVASLAGASTDTLLFMMITDALMIVSGLIGALCGDAQVKWVFWFIGMWFFAPIVYYLVNGLNANAAAVGGKASAAFSQVAWLTAISWSFYPIVWAMAEGTGVISCDTEATLYCVLDVTAKAVFGFMIVSARDALGEIFGAEVAAV